MYTPYSYPPTDLLKFNTIEHHCKWFKTKSYITETLHRFLSSRKTLYRRMLEGISYNILNKRTNNIINLSIENPDIEYYKFEFYKPFAEVPIMNIIDKLNIYVAYDYEDPDNICIDDNYKLDEYLLSELPFYRSIGTHINYMTLILQLPINPNITDVSKTISHELRHALDKISDQKLSKFTEKQNKLRDDFLSYATIYGWNDNNVKLFKLAAHSVYFTQDTEIDAHIETAVIDFKGMEISKEKALDMCKHPKKYEKIIIERGLTTLYNYYICLETALKFNKNNAILNSEEAQFIVEEICSKHTKKNFKVVLNSWIKQYTKFFQKLGSQLLNLWDEF